MLETLRRHFAVTLLTADPVDWEEVNRIFGTSIGPGDVEVLRMNRALRMLFRLDPDPESIQPLAYMMRVCQRIFACGPDEPGCNALSRAPRFLINTALKDAASPITLP